MRLRDRVRRLHGYRYELWGCLSVDVTPCIREAPLGLASRMAREHAIAQRYLASNDGWGRVNSIRRSYPADQVSDGRRGVARFGKHVPRIFGEIQSQFGWGGKRASWNSFRNTSAGVGRSSLGRRLRLSVTTRTATAPVIEMSWERGPPDMTSRVLAVCGRPQLPQLHSAVDNRACDPCPGRLCGEPEWCGKGPRRGKVTRTKGISRRNGISHSVTSDRLKPVLPWI